MASLKTINQRIALTVHPSLTLVKGEGYHYFVFDTPTQYETHSVMTPYTNQLTLAAWIEHARGFFKRLVDDKARSVVASAVDLIARYPNEPNEVGELILRHASDRFYDADIEPDAVELLDTKRNELTPYAF